ncbi:MAG: glycine zipper family protein [Burkholderiales bacterium]|nr:glycine zipper family protein [Burkholderiales bacterium]
MPRRPLPRPGVSILVACLVAAQLAGCVVAPAHRRPVYGPEGHAAGLPTPAAPPLYFYPEQGQPEGQQDRDRYECYRWAYQQTGLDPGMTPIRQPRYPQPLPPVRDGADVVAGGITGAALGAAVSSPRHAGENAVIGALLGFALGAIAQESRAQAMERAQARQQAAAAAAQVPMDNFRRAMSACMQGRGYRVG